MYMQQATADHVNYEESEDGVLVNTTMNLSDVLV